MSGVGRGRPLRFLLLLAVAWIAARIAMLWPAPKAAADAQAVMPAATPGGSSALANTAAAPPRGPHRPEPAPSPPRPSRLLQSHRLPPESSPPPWRVRSDHGTATMSQAPSAHPESAALPRLAPAMPLAPQAEQAFGAPSAAFVAALPRASAPSMAGSRWSGSAWMVARGGVALAPGALGGQLGGSQAGARLVYALDPGRRIAIVGRVTTPLGDGLREASLGIEWQPTRLPVRLVAEQRVALSDGQGGPGVGVIGGFGPIDIDRRFRAESYAQMGIIRRAATEPYVDGAVRITHPIASAGKLRFDLGCGAWGGAQRGATRLDLGPSLGAAVPLGKQSVRFALDWRQRIVGDAHPGSGPALTLGSDF